jgi:uncharacterized membrane protein
MQFDPPPFILFNLIMSAEAAYATPLILMAQNRQAVADHQTLNDDFALDRESERRIEEIQAQLDEILRRLGAPAKPKAQRQEIPMPKPPPPQPEVSFKRY